MMSPVSLPYNVATGQTIQARRRLFPGQLHIFASGSVELNKLGQATRLAWNWIPISIANGSDDGILRPA